MNCFIVLTRFLVQSRVWFCATLHSHVPGECGGQSAAVRLQGSGLHPGTRVTQVPLQRRAGQVRVHYMCVAVGELVKQKLCVSLNESVCLFLCDSCVWLFRAQCSYSTCSLVSLLLGQLAQVLFLGPPHQHTKLTLPHKDIREVSISVPGG